MTRRPHVLVLSGVPPHTVARTEAATVITYYIVRGLAECGRFHVSHLCVNHKPIIRPEAASGQLRELEQLGVRFLRDLVLPDRLFAARGWDRWRAVLTADPAILCRGYEHGGALKKHLGDTPPDVVVTSWSEYGTAMAATLGVPVVAYYGNPDPKTARTVAYTEWKFAGWPSSLNEWRSRLGRLAFLPSFTRAHMKVMRSLAGLLDVAANDAEYYRRRGIGNARYVRNMWGDPVAVDWESRRDGNEQESPLKIVGNVGVLGATGNTLGMQMLLGPVLSELRQRLGEGNFEIHLFGGGTPHPTVERLMADPHVKVRGFVPDLDAEILSAPVFVVANNHDPIFRVGNTRVLHAWSLGACCVAFDGIREAMPEIIDNENALLADNPHRMVEQIARAAGDRALRRRLGRSGFETTNTLFNPAAVVKELVDEVERGTRGYG